MGHMHQRGPRAAAQRWSLTVRFLAVGSPAASRRETLNAAVTWRRARRPRAAALSALFDSLSLSAAFWPRAMNLALIPFSVKVFLEPWIVSLPEAVAHRSSLVAFTATLIVLPSFCVRLPPSFAAGGVTSGRAASRAVTAGGLSRAVVSTVNSLVLLWPLLPAASDCSARAV